MSEVTTYAVSPNWWGSYYNANGTEKAARIASEQLYRATTPESPDPDNTDYLGYAYTSKGLITGDNTSATLPSNALYLKNEDGTYFTVEFGDDAKISLVAERRTLALYVYRAAGEANKYQFSQKDGKILSQEPTVLDAIDVSTAEAESNVDIDYNGAIGGKLYVDPRDQEGGLYKINVLGTELYIIGDEIEDGKAVDASGKTLFMGSGDDQTPWEPDDAYDDMRVVRTAATVDGESVARYEVFLSKDGTDSIPPETYKAIFDENRVLIEDSFTKLDEGQLAQQENQYRRDLNGDNSIGVNVNATAIDTDGDLYQGTILGQNFYMVGRFSGHDSSAKGATLSGALVNSDETAWELDAGLEIVSSLDTSYVVGDERVTRKTIISRDTSDANVLIRYDFELADSSVNNAAGNPIQNYAVTSESSAGIDMTAKDLAELERVARRDLNADSSYAVNLSTTAIEDETGLRTGTLLGETFILVSRAPVSTQRRAVDLSTAFTTDGVRPWTPDNVDTLAGNLKLISNDDDTFTVYANEGNNQVAKYIFDSEYVLQTDRELLTREDLFSAEVSSAKDLNGDGAYGVEISSIIDARSGLYGATFDDKDLYIVNAGRLTVGSEISRRAIDSEMRLQTEGGFDWDVDETGLVVQSAYFSDDNSQLNVIASKESGAYIKKYVFDNDGSSLIENTSQTAVMSLIDLTAVEKTQRRDLNGDSQVGAVTSSTLDRVGGLHIVTAAEQSFLTLARSRAQLGDLSGALLESGEAWSIPGDYTSVIAAENPDDTTQNFIYVVNQPGAPATADDYTYTRYTFDSEGEFVENSALSLSLADLSAAEKSTGRDINGDRYVGARVTNTVDRSSGLFTATIDGKEFVGVSAGRLRTADLSTTAFKESNEIDLFEMPSTESLQMMIVGSDGDSKYTIYARTSDNNVKAYEFDTNRNFKNVYQLNAEQLIEVESTASQSIDLNSDGAVGMKIDSEVDRVGGLYQASIMGDNYYLIGNRLRTGSRESNAIDLSKALLDANGAAWAPPTEGASEYSIAGIVTNFNDLTGEATGYDVYSYLRTDPADANTVTDVKKSSWEIDGEAINYVETKTADPVSLIELEKVQRRDLTGDNVIGFRKNDDDSPSYQGVTKATVYGSMAFFLAGTNLTQGRRSNPLSLKNALLNVEGTGAFTLENGYNIVSVREYDDSGAKRDVYAKREGNDTNSPEFIKYTFNAENGRLLQTDGKDFVDLTIHDIAKAEVDYRSDLDNDSDIGVVFTEEVNTNGQWTGLIKGEINGDTYFMAKSDYRPNKGNLGSALLNADGSAWTTPSTMANFVIKGVHETTDYLDVYGYEETNSANMKRFRFISAEASLGLTDAYVLTESSTEVRRTVSSHEVAQTEDEAGIDINKDGYIGFGANGDFSKYDDTGFGIASADARQSGASSSSGGNDDVYIVGNSLSRLGSRSDNTANSAALVQTFGSNTSFWKPDTGFTISDIWKTEDADANPIVNVYAQHSDGQTIKYAFSKPEPDSNWTLDSARYIDYTNGMKSKDVVADEVGAARDFNSDGSYGLTIGGTQNIVDLFVAEVGSDTYYVVGENLSTGTELKPLGFDGLLMSSETDAWEESDGFSTKSVVYDSEGASVYIVENPLPADDAFPSIVKLEFAIDADNALGSTYVQTEASATVQAKIGTEDGLADEDKLTVYDLIADEVSSTKDLDGNGVVGLSIDNVTFTTDDGDKTVGGLYVGSVYDTDILIESLAVPLASGTAAKPVGTAGSLTTGTGDAKEAWDPRVAPEGGTADVNAITAMFKDGTNLNLYGTTDTSVIKYVLSASDDEWSIDTTADGAKTELSGAAFILEETTAGVDLNGDRTVGLSVIEEVVTGRLTKAQGLADEDIFYLAGRGFSDGSVANPLGLDTALLANGSSLDDIENATFWSPGEGLTLVDFQDGTYEFQSNVVDAAGETGVPETAVYAAVLNDGSDDSVVFFDANFAALA